MCYTADRFQSSCTAAAATAAGKARAVTNSFQGQLTSMQQAMQSLHIKVLLVPKP